LVHLFITEAFILKDMEGRVGKGNWAGSRLNEDEKGLSNDKGPY